MDARLSGSVARPRFYALLLGLFATLAVVLAAVGVYGIFAYTVSQRRREIGIRMAVGARQASILALVLRQGATLTALGLVFGVLAALATTRLLRGLLFGVTPNDMTTFVVAPLVLGAVGLLACYLPARRAARVGPVLALRGE
jgi:ABC-type antimicrobial peptide transport system permease subunit